MNLAYYADFKSRNSTPYRVEIYTKNDVDSPKELTLSSVPFTTEWEADTLFKPLKMSNSVCRILTREMLMDLYTGEAQGVKIVLIDSANNKVEWAGYVMPNVYSSDYISVDSVDIEAIDTIACLENIKYSYIGENASFCSFYDIMMHIINKADPQKSIDKLRVQECNKVSYFDTDCILESLYINEHNFFDELGEPMTCKDVLSSLVGYLGMSMFQWKDSYYIVDYECIKKGYTECYQYHRAVSALNGWKKLTLENKNVLDIGIASGNGSISLDNVYNKVSVVASTNSVDELCPVLIDDEDLINQNEDPNKYYEEVIGDTTFISAYFKSKENWKPREVSGVYPDGIPNADKEITDVNIKYIGSGAFFQKNSSYTSDNGIPSSLDWVSYLTFIMNGRPTVGYDYSFLTLLKENSLLLNGGYIIINFNYKLSQSYIADDNFKSDSSDLEYNIDTVSDCGDTKFYCRLKIGDYYYNGEEWRLYSEYLDNYSYYNVSLKEENNCYYYQNVNTVEWIRIEKDEYDKRKMRDRFFIVRRNKKGEKVFDTWYTPTNQVSYKENLSNSSDGVLIKIPQFCLYGNISFELYRPNTMGTTVEGTTVPGTGFCSYCHFKDLSIKYTDKKYVYDVFGDKLDDCEDIVYSNVISDEYVTEAEDVKLLVNSYSKNILSYSNVATKKGTKFDYLKSMYSCIDGEYYLPEQLLVDKMYRHYKSPKVIYKNSD